METTCAGFLYFVWHIPALGQFAQLQPQELFPFFLSLTILYITRPITAATTAATTIVEILLIIKLSMYSNPLLFYMRFLFVSIFANQQVYKPRQQNKGNSR